MVVSKLLKSIAMFLLLLILIAFASLIRLIIEIKGQLKCPDEEVLKSVVLGKKKSAMGDQVIKHLGICNKCRKRVKSWNKD